MSMFRVAATALLALSLSTAASAAPIVPATGATTIQLGVLPVSVTALGNAVDNGGGSFSFPVTGVWIDGTDTTLYHEGSGLQVGPLALTNFQYTLGAPPAFPITVFGDVNGADDNLPLLLVDDELGLSLTPLASNALGLGNSTVAIGEVTGIDYTVTPPVPEPTTLLLLGSALAVAARRIRR